MEEAKTPPRESDDHACVDRPEREWPGLVMAALFTVTFLAAGAYLAASGADRAYMNLSGRLWKPVEAVVLAGRIETTTGGLRAFGAYKARISFQYVVGETAYVSNRYDLTEESSSFYSGQRRILDSHPPGTFCTAYYNPSDPSQAVLSRDVGYGFLKALILGIAVATVGVVLTRALFTVIRPHVGEHTTPETSGARRITPVFASRLTGKAREAFLVSGLFVVLFVLLVGTGEWQWTSYAYLALISPLAVSGAKGTRALNAALLERGRLAGLALTLGKNALKPGDTCRWEAVDPGRRMCGAIDVKAYLVYGKGTPSFRGGIESGAGYYVAEIVIADRRLDPPHLSGEFTIAVSAALPFREPRQHGGWYLCISAGKRHAAFELPVRWKATTPDYPTEGDTIGSDHPQGR